MIAAARYAREHAIPCLGLCLGLQVMVIDVARHLAGLERANSREFDSTTPHPVIDLMDEQYDVVDMGGTMRLGAYPAMLTPGSQVAAFYGTEVVSERHRHRYEVNSRYRSRLEAAGLCCSGNSPDGRLVEFIELPGPPVLGRAPRPTPSSRAGPSGPTRSSASWSARRSSGPRAASRTSSSSTSAERGPRWTRRRGAPGFVALGRRDRLAGPPRRPWTGRRFLDPDGERVRARVHRAPRARSGSSRWTTTGWSPSSASSGARCGTDRPRDAGRHLRRRRRAARGDGPARAGRGGGPGGRRSSSCWPRSRCRRGCTDQVTRVYLATGLSRCDTDREGPEERAMTVERGRPRRGPRHGRATASCIDAPTLAGGGAGPPGARRREAAEATGGRRAMLSDDAEEFLSWLTVERGRAELTVARLPARPGRLRGARWRRRGKTAADADHGATSRTTWPRCARAATSPASIARAQSVLRGLHQFLVDEDRAVDDPTAEVDGTKLPSRLPKALSEEEIERLLAHGPVAATPGHGATGRCSSSSTAPAPGSARRSASTWPTWPAGEGLIRLYGKGSKERLVPLGAMCRQALDAWLGDLGRGALEPVRWRRRDDSEAVFLNLRGGRLTPPGRLRGRRRTGPGGRHHAAGQPPRAAALLCHPHAGPRRRHPGRPGALRPRLDRDHPALHQGLGRAPALRLRVRAPPGPAHGRRTARRA